MIQIEDTIVGEKALKTILEGLHSQFESVSATYVKESETLCFGELPAQEESQPKVAGDNETITPTRISRKINI